MLDRYSLPVMQALWSEQNKWYTMNQVELAFIRAKVDCDLLPWSVYEAFEKYTEVSIHRIEEIEKLTGHDVIAFVKTAQESLQAAGVAEYGEYHKGLSSFTVQDPANMMRLREANLLITQALVALKRTLSKMALEQKWTLMMAYTHVQDAEPTTFGHLLANYSQQIAQRIIKLQRIYGENLCWANFGGTAGTFAGLDPEVCEIAAQRLGLKLTLSTQIISRDNHAEFINELAITAGVIEEIFRTFHLRMHSAIHELQEGKSKTYRGSTAMSHKSNPNGTEQLFGLARVMRGYAMMALENIETLDYRDIAQSAPSRIIWPDATALIHYMIVKAQKLAKNLVIFQDQMNKRVNEDSFGVWATQPVRLALMDAGVSYDDAYLYTQKCAFESVANRCHMFDMMCQNVISDSDNRTAQMILGEEKLRGSFDAINYIKDGIEFCFQLAFSDSNKDE